MQINFVGHGLDDKTEKNVGRIICSAFNKPKYYNRFIGLTAFATNSGLSQLISYISDAKATFKQITFYIGVNDQVTTREALQSLLDNEIETYIFFIEDKLFHPKVYMFEGDVRNKIIVGSSNLTRPGLFVRNIESSIEIDYDSSDSAGKKFRKQINDYFKYLFNNSHSHLKLLSDDYLKELIEMNIVRDEIHWLRNNKYEERDEFIGNLPRRKKRRPDKIGKNLGDLAEPKKRKSGTTGKSSWLTITDDYLRTWDFYFEELKKYKADHSGSTIVSRKYHDKALYRWYVKQKVLYNHKDENGVMLIPQAHFDALESIGFFWKDGNILRKLKIWEGHLQKSVEYSKKRKLPHTWVTWEKKDPKFPYKRQAEWCLEQRMRLKGTLDKPLSEYEKKRLKEEKFLEESENEGGVVNQDSFIQRLIELENLKTRCLKNGIRRWIPSQTDSDPKIAELGNWLADNITWIKNHRKNGTQTDLVYSRSKDLNDLGIDTIIGKEKNNFEFDVLDWLDMRKLYPNENPKREARVPFKKVLDWEASQKNRFDTWPEWRQKRLIELKIVKL